MPHPISKKSIFLIAFVGCASICFVALLLIGVNTGDYRYGFVIPGALVSETLKYIKNPNADPEAAITSGEIIAGIFTMFIALLFISYVIDRIYKLIRSMPSNEPQ